MADLKGAMIDLVSGDGAAIGCYRSEPDSIRRGGLILIQEIFGVTEHIKELCDHYAAEGYEVLAPQLFDRMEKNFDAAYTEEGIARSRELADSNPWEDVVNDVQTCINYLAPSGPVFITGFCYGGSVSWVASCRCSGLAAAAGFYGRLIIDFVGESPKCPTLLHFGKHDAMIPMEDVEKIQATHPNVPVHVYDAGHGFCSDRRADYDPDSAALAKDRTLQLFQDNG